MTESVTPSTQGLNLTLLPMLSRGRETDQRISTDASMSKCGPNLLFKSQGVKGFDCKNLFQKEAFDQGAGLRCVAAAKT